MELFFEMLSVRQFVPPQLCQKIFTQAGGVIGLRDDCDWIIRDRKRHLSSHHALISYREGTFFLTDTSSNGIQNSANGTRLRQGEAVRIEHGSIYVLGDFEIRAWLARPPATIDVKVGVPQAAGSTIPNNTFLDPLKFAVDAGDALGMLLPPNQPGQLLAEQVISRAFADLQTHQLALLTASRAAMRGTLEHFSPQRLTLRFERDNKPLLATAGSHWRAYNRYHRALCLDADWSERVLARDFTQTYNEQIRLISALYTDH